jgi:hypothetical protein
VAERQQRAHLQLKMQACNVPPARTQYETPACYK